MQTMPIARTRKATRFRWLVVFLAFIAIITNYMDRANLSIALPYMNAELHLSSAESGLILGAFFWTYAAFQIPAGMLVDRIGAKTVFAAAVLWWSLFTMATSLARGAATLLGLRFLLGVGEAGAFPAATKLVERWFPPTERGFASGIYDCGARGGTLIALPICTAIITAYGWRTSFIATGAVGLLWVVAWLLVASEFPSQNRFVNVAEATHIAERTTVAAKRSATVKWGKLFTSRVVWAMSLGFACQGYVIYFFITWYPTYLVKARGFTLLQLGFYGILPGLAGLVGSWLGGWVSDRIAASNYGLNFARKGCIVVGMALSATIGLAGIVTQAWLALLLLSIAFFGVSVATSSILALPADMSAQGRRSVAGTVAGFQNCIANIAGIASPAVIGYLKDATGSFTPGLISASIVAIVGCLIYIFALGPIRSGVFEDLIKD
ncbi:putative glucarate transporter [Paraburkholderia caribensis MBA4]|uniref:Putative glucarate transporter n=1 Tax=Paraburkholderia caribensis MBA4 TaxID=1323664 RepID=A0A0P0RIH0_9BURK|nr:MFS transporter [Paraburkholderia caribensis]ALL68440.1 putative glucarate transporter [Paraburkholderia caribensis MBA4]